MDEDKEFDELVGKAHELYCELYELAVEQRSSSVGEELLTIADLAETWGRLAVILADEETLAAVRYWEGQLIRFSHGAEA
jgi:hypothetical protein